jgi:hypothetical protein
MAYRIEKDGKYLTGNIAKGNYEFTSFFVYRYLFDHIEIAEKIAALYDGIVVKE